jgi:hypothetical protein
MYIWKVYKLAKEFRSGTVTERQQLYYLLVFIILSYIVSDTYINSLTTYETHNWLDILMLPLGLTIGIAGTIYCYKAARGFESNTGFLARYICLGLPILVQLVVTVVAVMFLLFAMNEFVFSIPNMDCYLESDETMLFDVIAYSAIEIFYYLYLGNAIRASYA